MAGASAPLSPFLPPGTPPLPQRLSTIHYVDAATAAALDERLMATPTGGRGSDSGKKSGSVGPACGFTLPALMELAGQAVAHATAAAFPDRATRVAVLVGPGNNGGDGLVAARHLVTLGYPSVVVLYPSPRAREPFVGLLSQLAAVGVPLVDNLPAEGEVDVLVDALFGFSFSPPVRPPFGALLQEVRRRQQGDGEGDGGGGGGGAPPPPAVVVVDVPSGWGVDAGEPAPPTPADPASDGAAAAAAATEPPPPAVANCPSGRDVLVSLSAPKRGALAWRGAHYVGGRFVPPRLAAALGFELVRYQGDALVQLVQGGEGGTLDAA